MKKYIEVVAVCPLLGGKPCINDGLTCEILMNKGTAHRCMLWDGDSTYNGVSPEEPCRFIRAINKLLADEIQDFPNDKHIEVPFDTKRR